MLGKSSADARRGGRLHATREPWRHSDGIRRAPRRQRSSSLLAARPRSAPREPSRETSCLDALRGTRPRPLESLVRPWRECPPRRISEAPGHRRSLSRSAQSREQLDSGGSFNTCIAQNAVSEPSRILLRVYGDPDFLAGYGMFQQFVTSFSGPVLHESRSLQLADHLGPRHKVILNLTLGFTKSIKSS